MNEILNGARLGWVRWIASRYLRSKKGSRFLSFITVISIVGVGLGVTSMGVVLSVMEGFEGELKKRLMGTELHLLITPQENTPLVEPGFMSEGLVLDNVDFQKWVEVQKPKPQIFPIIQTEAILKSGRRVTGVVAKGIGFDRMEKLKTQLTETADPVLLSERQGREAIPPAKIFIGKEMAFEMGLIPGDFVTLVSPTETDGPLSSVPRLKRFVIAGVYHSGMPEQELHTVFIEQSSLRSFLKKAQGITQWEVSVNQFDQASDLGDQMKKRLPLLRVQDWKELNSSLFFSLKLERIMMFIALSFIVLVASFNIVTTLTLMVQEKRREIAILKTMGATHGQVAGIFLMEGIFIGGIGVGGGLILTALLSLLLRRYEFITLPDIYYDRTLPVVFNPVYYVVIAVTAVIIVLLASILPSRRAAAADLLQGIRQG